MKITQQQQRKQQQQQQQQITTTQTTTTKKLATTTKHSAESGWLLNFLLILVFTCFDITLLQYQEYSGKTNFGFQHKN